MILEFELRENKKIISSLSRLTKLIEDKKLGIMIDEFIINISKIESKTAELNNIKSLIDEMKSILESLKKLRKENITIEDKRYARLICRRYYFLSHVLEDFCEVVF